MNQFKRAQVIMLPTENKQNAIWLDNSNYLLYNHFLIKQKAKGSFQHLYIISDDEIKENDWYYTPIKRSIEQCLKQLLVIKNGNNDIKQFKIIATTDTSLKFETIISICGNGNKTRGYKSLPQPSQQFIEKYIESYNKGEIITDVLVEYNVTCYKLLCSSRYKLSIQCTSPSNCEFEILKVNYKDNTITIKKLKDSFNLKDLKQAFEAGFHCPIAGATFEEWYNHIGYLEMDK